MSDPVSTDLTINVSLNAAQPTLGADSSGSVSIAYTATQKATAGGNSSNQFLSNPTTPTLKVYRSATNTITWNLQSPTGDWRLNDMPSTHIIGIVVDNGNGSVTNGKGGAAFAKGTNTQSYASSKWASKNVVYGGSGLTTAQITQRNPFLLLSPNSTHSLTVNASDFFDKSGNNYTAKTPSPAGSGNGSSFIYDYRIYFYTGGQGVWWDDPSFDVTPTVGSGGDPF